ncbi:MAG: glycosyltransferase family 2 protein [Fimbriiglobus sp.]
MMTRTPFPPTPPHARFGAGNRLAHLPEDTPPMTVTDPAGKLSVLIPVYNEEKTVDEIITRVLALGPVVKELVIVDDGSADRTAEVVRARAETDSKVRFFQAPKNEGKTAAIRRALAEATGDIIIIQDADLEYDPAEIPDVIGPILSGHADVVFGSRFLVRKAARVLYFRHYLANVGLTFLCNMLTNRNMTDIETCYKAFRKEVIKPLTLTSKGFGMEVELSALVCKTQARTYEVPISYYGRSYEEGKHINTRDGIDALWYILYYNLVKPFTRSGRDYVKAVNEGLARRVAATAR